MIYNKEYVVCEIDRERKEVILRTSLPIEVQGKPLVYDSLVLQLDEIQIEKIQLRERYVVEVRKSETWQVEVSLQMDK